MLVNLTAPQAAILRKLIRDEAKRLGYGTTYDYYDTRGSWPKRLRELAAIMRKIAVSRAPLDGR